MYKRNENFKKRDTDPVIEEAARIGYKYASIAQSRRPEAEAAIGKNLKYSAKYAKKFGVYLPALQYKPIRIKPIVRGNS